MMFLLLLINIVISIDSSKGAQFLQIQIFILQSVFKHSHFSLSLEKRNQIPLQKRQRKRAKGRGIP